MDPVRIGDEVTFKHHNTTMQGRVVGRELVDDPRRGPIGERFIVATADREAVEVPAARIGGKLPS